MSDLDARRERLERGGYSVYQRRSHAPGGFAWTFDPDNPSGHMCRLEEEAIADAEEAFAARLAQARLLMKAGFLTFEPSDAQVAWAMNVAGPLELQDGATLERVLGTERYAVLVRTIISAAQSQTADDLDAYAESSTLLKRIADTRGRQLWGAEPRPAPIYARQPPRS